MEDNETPADPIEPSKIENQSQADRFEEKPSERVLMPFWTSLASRKQLKYIAVGEDRTQQALLAEALNMFFESRGKPAIA